jgi:uncharacterized damage-inducible protein DinB
MKITSRSVVAACLFVLCIFVSAQAQTAPAAKSTPAAAPAIPNPISLSEKGFYMNVRGNVTAAAEKMSEENYAFKPTPDVRTFGQLVGHVADAQYMFCSMALGETNPAPGIEKSKTSKADLVQALKDSNAYCDKAYNAMTDADAATLVSLFGRKMAKLMALSINTAHDDEHYGNMVTYMRLKGVIPPSSEPRK